MSGLGKALTPLRVLLMTGLILYLSYYVYIKFGVSDSAGWLRDVMSILLVILIIAAAAFGVVALLMFIRRKKEKI